MFQNKISINKHPVIFQNVPYEYSNLPNSNVINGNGVSMYGQGYVYHGDLTV